MQQVRQSLLLVVTTRVKNDVIVELPRCGCLELTAGALRTSKLRFTCCNPEPVQLLRPGLARSACGSVSAARQGSVPYIHHLIRCDSSVCLLQPGYERLCCLRCIQPKDHNFGTTCICRVPKKSRDEKVVECTHCGCRGCASGEK
jgi:hypothetical protein